MDDIECKAINIVGCENELSLEDKAGSESPDSASNSKERVALRFPTLSGKARPPSRYIHIDEALERLGKELFPNEWGIGDAWKEHPFLYVRKEKRAVTFLLKKRGRGFRLFRKVLETDVPRRDLKSSSRTYNEVRRTLKRALEDNLVQASRLTEDGLIEPIKKDENGLWGMKLKSIFYTGYGRDVPDGFPRKFRVLLDKQSLEKWLSASRVDKKNLPAAALAASLRRFASTLADRPDGEIFLPSKGEIKEILVKTLAAEGSTLTDYSFDVHFWKTYVSLKPAAGKPGRRSRPGASIGDVSELAELARHEFRRPPRLGSELLK